MNEHGYRSGRDTATQAATSGGTAALAPGKATLTMALPAVEAPIQRKASGDAVGGTGPQPAATGGGQAMPDPVRAKMERSFGADFSSVRIHQGGAAQSIGALGYTQGSDIHFAPGQYDPHSERGQELLGHELSHVVQQAQGRVAAPGQAKGLNVNDDAGLEREADQQGARAARGESVGGGGGRVSAAAGRTMQLTPGETIQRIAVALGVGLAIATAIYWALPATVATAVGGSAAAAGGGGLVATIGEYWAGVVNRIIGGGQQPAARGPAGPGPGPAASSASAPASGAASPASASASPASASGPPASASGTPASASASLASGTSASLVPTPSVHGPAAPASASVAAQPMAATSLAPTPAAPGLIAPTASSAGSSLGVPVPTPAPVSVFSSLAMPAAEPPAASSSDEPSASSSLRRRGRAAADEPKVKVKTRGVAAPAAAGAAAAAAAAAPAAPTYDAAVELANGTTIDYPALNAVMADVVLGVQVSPAVWRKMRQDLSLAITLPNKSHPAHGSNFNSPQRPEQQIRDWASPIQGPLAAALAGYFHSKGVDID